MKRYLGTTGISFLILCVCMACTSTSGVASESQEMQEILSDKGVGDSDLIRILSEVRKLHNVPAMAAALVTDQGLQKVAAVGTRKWGTDIPVTLNDMWHLGSDTKIMTSTLVAILVEQEKLKWTTTVSEVFPELADSFHPDFRNVNLLQLLSHMAGLPANLDFGSISGLGSVRDQRIEVVRRGLREKPLSTPGTKYLYSNVGYIIVGAMIERVTNMAWETAITQQVFTPLKMTSAGFGGLGTVGMIDQPWGHTTARKPVMRNGPKVDNLPVMGPAGRVHCTIQDWALFIEDQLCGARGEPALLKPESYQMLQDPHFDGDYALGWTVVYRKWADGMAFTHAGSNTMYFALAWVAPKKNYAILVCTNEGPDSFKAADEAVSKIIEIAEMH